MFAVRQGAMRWLAPVLAGILCSGLLVPTGVFAQSDLVTTGNSVTVTTTDGTPVLLRAAASYDAEVVTELATDTSAEIVDGPFVGADGSTWAEIASGETTGFIDAVFLVAGSASTDTADAVAAVEATAMSDDGSSVAAAVTGSAGTAVTTAFLNLRAGPSLSDRVLIVIPWGGSVSINGSAQSGFYPVTYNGVSGWAFGDYLAGNAGDDGSSSGGSDSARVTVALNLRAGPSTADAVVTVMPTGAVVTLTGQRANGFVSVTYNGLVGWAYATYLDSGGSAPPADPDPGGGTGSARVMVALHLRAGPSTAERSLLVMPAGASVTLTGNSANGFVSVTYSGLDGWAYREFLTIGGSPESPPSTEPDPPAGESAVTTADLNLRSGASLADSVILVMPAGATVAITGAAQNGFYPVTYGGTSGWAFGDYLTTGGGSGSNPPPNGGGGSIVWPVRGGTWQIIQGYNGGTHQNRSATAQYYYALDIARSDGATAGQPVLSPVNGTIRWVHAPSGGIAIDMGNGYVVAMFHATFDSSLGAGQTVGQGQYLGIISGPGGNGYASTPHIEIDVWRSSDGGSSRSSTPFSGGNAISGMSFPDTGGWNQHYGTQFNP